MAQDARAAKAAATRLVNAAAGSNATTRALESRRAMLARRAAEWCVRRDAVFAARKAARGESTPDARRARIVARERVWTGARDACFRARKAARVAVGRAAGHPAAGEGSPVHEVSDVGLLQTSIVQLTAARDSAVSPIPIVYCGITSCLSSVSVLIDSGPPARGTSTGSVAAETRSVRAVFCRRRGGQPLLACGCVPRRVLCRRR